LVVRHWLQLSLRQSLACPEQRPETADSPGPVDLTGYRRCGTV